MKCVAPGARHGIDNSPGRTTIDSRIVAGYDREFLHGVRTQIEPQYDAWGGMRIVVEGDTGHQISCFLGASARNSVLRSKAALSPARTGIRGVGLGANR